MTATTADIHDLLRLPTDTICVARLAALQYNGGSKLAARILAAVTVPAWRDLLVPALTNRANV